MVTIEKELDLICSAVLPRLDDGMVETPARTLATYQSKITIPNIFSPLYFLLSFLTSQ
jgi:hypothetical protein